MRSLRRGTRARNPRPADPNLNCLCGLYVQECTLLFGVNSMPIETTYTNLRERLASILDQVADNQEVVIVRRRGAKDVAMVPAEELTSLMETAHLLRSPRNARRLLTALRKANSGKGRTESVEKLRREIGLGPNG